MTVWWFIDDILNDVPSVERESVHCSSAGIVSTMGALRSSGVVVFGRMFPAHETVLGTSVS